jgi:hypothetical protein
MHRSTTIHLVSAGLTPRVKPCRIVRDYEKYVTRQFKRGTSRQELNVSWLKKNEMDLKRHVQELRENITNNWTSTGQELSRELRGFWPASRPQSPARFSTSSNSNSPANDLARSPTGPGGANSKEFLTGYAVGLVGGVRSWVSILLLLYPSNPCATPGRPPFSGDPKSRIPRQKSVTNRKTDA